jgi:hypothetical protein
MHRAIAEFGKKLLPRPRDDLADQPEGLLDPNIPLARRDAPFGGDTCGNAGGLDQDIFGISFTP